VTNVFQSESDTDTNEEAPTYPTLVKVDDLQGGEIIAEGFVLGVMKLDDIKEMVDFGTCVCGECEQEFADAPTDRRVVIVANPVGPLLPIDAEHGEPETTVFAKAEGLGAFLTAQRYIAQVEPIVEANDRLIQDFLLGAVDAMAVRNPYHAPNGVDGNAIRSAERELLAGIEAMLNEGPSITSAEADAAIDEALGSTEAEGGTESEADQS
jgi:hypothetical protein